MSRFAQEGLDDAVATVGDGVFAGVDLSREPMSLEPGLASEAVNVRFRGNRAETRPGLVACGWGVDRALALPADFLLEAATSAADVGTGGVTGLAFDVVRVFDRGIYELKFTRSNMRTAGEVGPSVGDSVTASAFTTATIVNGTYLVTYAGDNSIRVEVDEDTWDAAPSSAASGELVWEGTVDFGQVQGFGTVYGVAVFSDPNGREGVLVAQGPRARLLRDGQIPQSIPYPEGVELSAPVRFIQAFDRVLMLRGFDDAPLVWIPANDFMTGPGAFETIEDQPGGSASFLEPIPNAATGVEFNGRFFLQYGRDQVAISDVYDYLHYDPVFNAMRINEGSDDSIVRLLPFGRQRMLVFFNQSVWVLDNVFGDLSTMRGDVLTRERGAVSHDAIVQMGPDVWFLSEGGVYSLAQTESAQLQAAAAPISAPVQPLIDRINWQAASGAQAASDDGMFYLAVPIDGATYNNALLVYDQKTQRWQGLWQSALLDAARLIRTDHAGRRRLVIVTGDGLATVALHGALLALDAGADQDEACGERADIAFSLVTRAYTFGNLARQRAQLADVMLSHSGGKFRIRELADGVGETRTATGTAYLEPDRTQYHVFSKADYVVTNANDDHAAPYREDYSVEIPVETARGWLWAVVNNNPATLSVSLKLMTDYEAAVYSPAFAYSGDLPAVAAGDVIDATGFLADTLNRSWLVTSVATGNVAVCAVTSAEKAAIIAECDALYSVSSGNYVMPDATGTPAAGVRSWAFANALTSQPARTGASGIAPDLMQQRGQRLRLRSGGQAFRLAIENVQGRVAVLATAVGARGQRRACGVSV